MLEFVLSEEQALIVDIAKNFATFVLKPIASEIDANEKIPKNIIEELGNLGLFGVSFPVDYGGSGFGEVGYCLVAEQIGRMCLSTATFMGAHVSIAANSIYFAGTEEQKQKYLPLLATGAKIGAFALTETEAGSDAFNISTRAEFDDNTHEWILNGSKHWITNAPIADIFIVFAKTSKGIAAFIVEREAEGLSVGAPEKKMGIRGSQTASITLEDVRIPQKNILGSEGKGFIVAMRVLDIGRLGLGAACLGACKELLDMSLQYAKTRRQFSENISNFQAIQFMLAEMETAIFQIESIVYRTASMYDNGKILSKHASIVKLAASEALDLCADYAVQIHGGLGYSAEYPIERYYRDSRINRIFEGTSEIQKIVIAHDLINRKRNV